MVRIVRLRTVGDAGPYDGWGTNVAVGMDRGDRLGTIRESPLRMLNIVSHATEKIVRIVRSRAHVALRGANVLTPLRRWGRAAVAIRFVKGRIILCVATVMVRYPSCTEA